MLKIEEMPKVAKKTVEQYILHGEMYELDEDLSKELQREAGVFVTLKKDGDLRGCIGTIRPTQKNIAAEVQKNAISAAEHDPRFPALKENELKTIIPESEQEKLLRNVYSKIIKKEEVNKLSKLLIPSILFILKFIKHIDSFFYNDCSQLNSINQFYLIINFLMIIYSFF